MKAFIQHILSLTFSLGVIFCFGQDEYESFSKKEMRVLLQKRDSVIKSNQAQITRYEDLTKDLNLQMLSKRDSIEILIENYKSLISEINDLQAKLTALEKEKLLLANEKVEQIKLYDKIKQSLDAQLLSRKSERDSINNEMSILNKKIVQVENDLMDCSDKKSELLVSSKMLSKTIENLNLLNDSLEKEMRIVFPQSKGSSGDILNNMYFNQVYPNELHSSLEFSGVIITSLNGGGNTDDNDSYRNAYNLDEYIVASHSPNDYDWNRDYYSKGNWSSYDNDYRNPKWQVYFATEFIPKSKLSITNMNGTSRSLNFKFDLLNGIMITLSNDNLEENTFLCQWKTDYYFGKRVVLWNLAHQKAGEMRDLFMRTFEINGEAYIALNNFQLLRLKSGFAPIKYNYDEKSEYYTFESLTGNNKILTRLKDDNSQSTALDPAYCIYLFKLVK